VSQLERPMAKNCDVRIGAMVSASKSEIMTATEIVMPNWKKNLPTIPCMNMTGMKMARIAIEAAKAANVAVAYDSNLRLRLWSLARAKAVITATIALADYFLPSLDDVRLLCGLEHPEAIVDWCHRLGVAHVALKLGAEGVLASDGHTRQNICAHRVDCVDATGAGDCFAGCFLACLSQGEDFWQAVRYANAAAALTTTGFGAVAPLPRPAAVRALLARPFA